MENLINIINSKINNLDSTIEDLLYDELLITLSDIKKEFRNNPKVNLEKYFKKLTAIQNVQKNTSPHFLYQNNENKIEKNDIDIEDSKSYDSISVSSTITQKPNHKDIESKINVFSDIPEDNYYFYNLNENYGEVENNLNINYSLKTLEEFKLFSIKISGLKLFDNIFLGRTISEATLKLLSFLFILNEKPFITICEKNSKYFSTSPSSMKRAINLKENKCYIESNINENESVEMLTDFLNHIKVSPSACKVLLNSSTTKPNEKYITFIL